MKKLTLDEAIGIVENFNIQNRFRDGAQVNNAIDEIIKAAKTKKITDEISSMSINEYTTGKDLFQFVKSQMKYDEVIQLYKLLKSDLDGTTQFNSSDNELETAVKYYYGAQKK